MPHAVAAYAAAYRHFRLRRRTSVRRFFRLASFQIGLGVVEAEDFGVVVVGVNLGVAAPVDGGVEHAAGFVFAEVIFQFGEKARVGRAVVETLVEHRADARHQRHPLDQVAGENLLALLQTAIDKGASGGQQHDVAIFHLGEAEQFHAFDQRKQVIHRKVHVLGQLGQADAGVGITLFQRVEFFEQAGKGIDRERWQPQADARRLFAHRVTPGRAGGHGAVNALDQIAELLRFALARVRQVDVHFADHPPGIRSEDDDAVGHEHGFFDVVRHQQNAAGGNLALRPQIEQVGAQGLGGEHVERGERLVHQQHVGVDDQRAGEAHALAHAARKLARIGGLKPVQTDEVDGGQRAGATFCRRHLERLQPQFHVLQHRQPGKQRKALKHHRQPRHRAVDRLAAMQRRAACSGNQPGQGAQQGGLARTGAPQQHQNFAVAQIEIDAVENDEFAALGGAIRLAHIRQMENGCGRRGVRCAGQFGGVHGIHAGSFSCARPFQRNRGPLGGNARSKSGGISYQAAINRAAPAWRQFCRGGARPDD